MHSAVVSLALVVAVGGCDDAFDLARLPDAPIPDADPCLTARYGLSGPDGTGLVEICLEGPPPATFTGGALIDTDLNTSCTQVRPSDDVTKELCVIAAETIDIELSTRAHGGRPLVLLATRTITIRGSVDVSSVRPSPGAGAGHPDCTPPNGQMGSMTIPGAGGAGGSFQTQGGAGGNGGMMVTQGGIPQAAIPVVTVRGGCRGGRGGLGDSTNETSAGNGGGAMYLIAGESIEITSAGLLNASGSAGGGGARGDTTGGAGCGGSGGGSGGLIGLDAPRILLASGARLVANGGGGGGSGSVGGAGPSGAVGSPPDTSTYPFPAAGGPTVIPGGAGADAVNAAKPGSAGGPSDAGGGGGGGLGYIMLFGQSIETAGAYLSPPRS